MVKRCGFILYIVGCGLSNGTRTSTPYLFLITVDSSLRIPYPLDMAKVWLHNPTWLSFSPKPASLNGGLGGYTQSFQLRLADLISSSHEAPEMCIKVCRKTKGTDEATKNAHS